MLWWVRSLWEEDACCNSFLFFPFMPFGKLFYYGDLLPNTFYAKGSENRWQQGLLYVGLFIQTYWKMVPILCLALWEFWKKRNLQLYWYVGICSTILFFHVIRVGGDFMFGRFVLPLIPFLLLMGQNGVESLFISNRNKQILIAIMSSLFLLLCRHSPDLETFQDGVVGIEGITEERYWYPHSIVEQAQRQGKRIERCFRRNRCTNRYFGYAGDACLLW